MSKPVVESAPKLDPSRDLKNFPDLNKYFDKYDATDSKGLYLHWSQLKWRVPKGEAEAIWKVVKFKGMAQMKRLPLLDDCGLPFSYCTPHSMEAMLHQVVKLAGAMLGLLTKIALQIGFRIASLYLH
jgi:hypothetical protein